MSGKVVASLCSGSNSAHTCWSGRGWTALYWCHFYSICVPTTCVLHNSSCLFLATSNHQLCFSNQCLHGRIPSWMITLFSLPAIAEQQWSPACSDITRQPLHIQQRVRPQPVWASFSLAGMMALLGFPWPEWSVFNLALTKQCWKYTISDLNKTQAKGRAIIKPWHWSLCVSEGKTE